MNMRTASPHGRRARIRYGTRLPDSKQDQWFDELEALGFEDPLFDDSVPEACKTDEWYRRH